MDVLFFSYNCLSEPFCFRTDQKLPSLFVLPYSVKSPNPYYYCNCYFIVIIIVTIIEQALDVWFEKIPPSILIMVISVWREAE